MAGTVSFVSVSETAGAWLVETVTSAAATSFVEVTTGAASLVAISEPARRAFVPVTAATGIAFVVVPVAEDVLVDDSATGAIFVGVSFAVASFVATCVTEVDTMPVEVVSIEFVVDSSACSAATSGFTPDASSMRFAETEGDASANGLWLAQPDAKPAARAAHKPK